MTQKQTATITGALVLIISTCATVLGHHVTTTQIHDVAGYVTAAVAASLTVLHAPTAAKVIKKKISTPTPPTIRFPAFGVDWSFATLTAEQLKQIGATFAIRYLSYTPSKNLTPAESRDLEAAGIKRVVVWETTAERATAGYSAGVEDAQAALEQARACGAPDDAVIFFAIDFDAQGPEIADYFHGAGAQLPGRVGAYGGYTAIAYLFGHNLISHAYQTYAWSNGRWHPRAQLLQYSNNHTFFGQAVDLDHALSAACGWW